MEPLNIETIGLKVNWIDDYGNRQMSFHYIQVNGKFPDLESLSSIVATEFKVAYEHTQEQVKLIRDKTTEHTL